MSEVVVVVALGLVPGCYLAHTREPSEPLRDAGVRIDAAGTSDAGGSPRDAAPSGGAYWTLERRRAQLRIEHELGCTQYEGGEITVTVSTPISSVCEHGGPIDVAWEGGVAHVTSWVWVQHLPDPSACPPTTSIAERTTLLPAREGTVVAVTDEGGSRVTYRASAIDDLPCTHAGEMDAPCLVDCECREGLRCLPNAGDFVECHGGTCGEPCNRAASGGVPTVYADDLECDPLARCVRGPAVSRRCEPRTEPCGVDSCGPGLRCGASPSAGCEWAIALSAAVRHPCADDTACAPGTYCVAGQDGSRSCEVPCFTTDMRCPSMHECRGGRWVCEWIGE